ncbi:MAG: hypothetical protein JSV49_05190 [Thermoplasmata archaeon]|nr:MAG: hypothetical protein JSV49_05190 [Thermoplasmata archaeon]
MRQFIIIILCFAAALLLLSPVSCAGNLDNYYDGIDEEIFGHSFNDEYWTKELENITENGDEVKFTVSYVNYNNVQAFLVALHSVYNPENGTGTLPYQLFGMHYVTESGQEVFVSALFAFLLAYNDTDGNGIPGDPTVEKRYHIIPFGAGKNLDETYPPKVTSISVEKKSDTHYTFGMRYENLYAILSENFVLSLYLKTGMIAKITELEITYDIKFNEEEKRVTAETFYKIGEVTELWNVWLGIPTPADIDIKLANHGLAAAHYVTIFTSKYNVVGSDSGNTLDTGMTKKMDENITIKVETDRAFEIGFRGDYTLYDALGQVQKDSAPAINILLEARPLDITLVLWQLGFSANIFSFMAYGLSENIRTLYESPADLKQKSLQPHNRYGFSLAALWYAVCFPEWEGYRVEHDPQYTANTIFAAVSSGEGEEEDDSGGWCGSIILVGSSLLAVPALTVMRGKRKV